MEQLQVTNTEPLAFGHLLYMVKPIPPRLVDALRRETLSYDWFDIRDRDGRKYFHNIKTAYDRIIRSDEEQGQGLNKYIVGFTYPEAEAILRLSKIVQLRIGEENEEQAFFQSVAQELSILL